MFKAISIATALVIGSTFPILAAENHKAVPQQQQNVNGDHRARNHDDHNFDWLKNLNPFGHKKHDNDHRRHNHDRDHDWDRDHDRGDR